MERKCFRVSGYVQGVGFRYFVKYTASLYGLTGWVRNLENGDVELEAQGSSEQLRAFLASLEKGNRFSAVERVEAWDRDVTAEYGFEIL